MFYAELSVTVLVTGATGFIGSWVVRALHRKNLPFVMSDVRFDSSRLRMLVPDVESLPFVEADLRQPDAFHKIFKEFDVERVIHLAALQIPQCRADPVLGGEINVVGFLRLFEAVKKHGGVKNIVYASSAAVYGSQELYGHEPIPENAMLKPTTHYGAFKVCNELSAYAYWMENKIPSIGIRPHTVYGFGRDVGVTSDVTTALKAAVLRKPFKIRFGGKISLQYAADVAESFVAAAYAKIDGAKVYNISGHVVEVSEIVETIHRMVPGTENLISYVETPLPVAHTLDDTAFRTEISDIKPTPVRQGLEETLEIYRRLNQMGELRLEA